MDGPPPPPPPHGEKPNTTHGTEYRKSSDLPQGNYDIFIIPPHSSGSGFLYLPSLQCQRNSFIAGAGSMLIAVWLWSTFAPMVRFWYAATVASGGGMGIAILAIGVVGIAGWAFGTYQAGSGGTSREGRRGPGFGSGWFRSGGPGSSGPDPSSSNNGQNYSRGGNFSGQDGGPHQQGNYGSNFGGGPPPGNQYSGNQYRANQPPPQGTPGSSGPNTGPGPNPTPGPGPNPGPKHPGTGPGPTPHTNPPGSTPQSESKPRSAEDWEKEREETRRKEELRRKMEEFKRKREAEAREKQKQREREAMERELRERREQLEKEMAAAKEKAAREAREQAEREAAEVKAKFEREAAELRAKAEREAAEAKARAEKEAAEARARAAEAREREQRAAAEARIRAEREAAEARAKAEREAAEAKAKAEKEAAEKEAAAKAAAKKEADAKFAALKEAAAKKYAEKKARDAQEAAAAKAKAAAASNASTTSVPPRTPSPQKPSAPPPGPDDDAYTFRPYDRPRRPYAGTSQSSVYSESSYAPSQSTARTTPPPSNRGPYETKDPDKIVIKGVYVFNQAFLRTPVAQLVSGQGIVTDGLVLRITTEGLFIDDDVRGVPQREWDIKAWTMKLVEVWCPQVGSPKQNTKANQAFFRRSTGDPTPEESDAYLANFLKVCKNTCRLASPAFFSRNGSTDGSETQPYGGLHVLRATIRDQEGRRYVFVLQETEGWKVALGLQRLRKGSQVRALGVCSMALAETRIVLGGLGY